jgi:hypothetical protein
MHRLALALAAASLLAAAWHAPGQYIALGAGIGAVGTGWLGYRDRGAPGAARLVAAGAITAGAAGLLLGALRVVLALAAIAHVERMLG